MSNGFHRLSCNALDAWLAPLISEETSRPGINGLSRRPNPWPNASRNRSQGGHPQDAAPPGHRHVRAFCALSGRFLRPSTNFTTQTPVSEASAAPFPIAASPQTSPAGPPILIASLPPVPEDEAPIAGPVLADAPDPSEPDATSQERVLVVTRGDTLAGLLDDAGVDRAEAHAAIASLARHFQPSSLRPGDEIAIRLDR